MNEGKKKGNESSLMGIAASERASGRSGGQGETFPQEGMAVPGSRGDEPMPGLPPDDDPTEFRVALDQAEHGKLLALLERERRDTRVEARRTESPDFQDEVHEQQAILESLIEKLRRR